MKTWKKLVWLANTLRYAEKSPFTQDVSRHPLAQSLCVCGAIRHVTALDDKTAWAAVLPDASDELEPTAQGGNVSVIIFRASIARPSQPPW